MLRTEYIRLWRWCVMSTIYFARRYTRAGILPGHILHFTECYKWYTSPPLRAVKQQLRTKRGISVMPASPSGYEEKFADFIHLCEESKANGIKDVIVASPEVIGDTEEETRESLTRLAAVGLTLHIAAAKN